MLWLLWKRMAMVPILFFVCISNLHVGTFSYVYYDACAPPPNAVRHWILFVIIVYFIQDKVFKEYSVDGVLGK